jgi:hypothetical protein
VRKNLHSVYVSICFRFAKNDTVDGNNRHVKRAMSILNSSVQKSKRIYKSDLENILLDVKKEGEYNYVYILLVIETF